MAKREIAKMRCAKPRGEVGRRGRGLLQALLTLFVVAIGVSSAVVLVRLRKPPARMEQEVLAPLVKVHQLNTRNIPMVIRGYGTVSPKIEVEIIPEVAGKVVSINPELKVGGFIPAGEQVLRIDPRDYELAVQQAKAAVADAQVKLDIEVAEAEVARREWEQLHPDTEPASPLVLREPQIRQAKAKLESATAQHAVAELRLERTNLSLPFDALIVSEKVDLGQYVVVGQPLGVAYAIEAVEIEVPLEDEELAWFDVFENPVLRDGVGPAVKKTPATVKADFAGAEHSWAGYVARTTGQVDRTSRMVSVVVEVPKPFDTSAGKPPLLPGAFVEVFIEGKVLKSAVAVPRDAIHGGNNVWLVNDEVLHIHALDIARADKDFAYVASGIDDGATVVVSSLDAVMEGMKVRTQAEAPQEADDMDRDDKVGARLEAD
jgi:RND family efflux transporter MFP subunit